MSNITKVFNFEDGSPVRVVMCDGELWFVAADVCKVLEIGNTSQAASYLEDDERGITTNDTPSGPQEMLVITEAGLYSLVLRSRKPQAKQFKRWITHEVLPAIRKHGAYMTPEKIEEALLNPDVLIRLATDLKTERQNRLIAEQQRDEAIRTKSMIGSTREATAMATASVASRKVKMLEERNEILNEQLGNAKNWKQVKAITWIREFFVPTQGLWSVLGKTLKSISEELDLEVRKVPDPTYGEVCSFRIEAINELHNRLQQNPSLMKNYRPDRTS